MPALIDLDVLLHNEDVDGSSRCTPNNLAGDLIIGLGNLASIIEVELDDGLGESAEVCDALLKVIDKAARKVIKISEPEYSVSMVVTMSNLQDAMTEDGE